ncbi:MULTISPECIES: hypothetical protein [unclassified Nostoc]|uniref:hypothetical protein n=1 Tax=unclassified Nostoc TaxID=2593658 RepID=UPI002AD925BC|nr:hypothetical protein [Nostoc sp. DedQUE02]
MTTLDALARYVEENTKSESVAAEDVQEELRSLCYTKRTPTSKQLAQSYRPVLADNRASAGFRFSTKEMLYPIVGDRSRGFL